MLSDGLLAAASRFTPPQPPEIQGQLWSWGNNSNGASGQNTDTGTTDSPTQITDPNFSDWDFVDGSGGLNTGAAIRDGRLYMWGFNDEYQLGLNDTTERLVPTQVGSDTNWAFVASGTRSTCAIKTDGTLWSWGLNSNFRTAQGTATGNTQVPTQVGSDTNWKMVSQDANESFYMAVKTDGTLWSWGSNANFQTGRGVDTSDTETPTQVGSDTDWDIVSAAGSFGCAVKTNGTLWSWGSNANGRTGQGTDAGFTENPTQVGSDTNWKVVLGSGLFAQAIKTNGTLWSWGFNSQYQLGLNDTDTRDVPTQVGSDTNWDEVASGTNHVIALKTNNTLWSWGQNSLFRTAQGTATGNTQVPTQVGSDTNWLLIGTAFATGFAIKSA